MLRTSRRPILLAVALALVAASCLPAAPATGRPGPVRRVLVLGDSIALGAFGSTAPVTPELERLMRDRSITVRVIGYPASTPVATWDGVPWADKLRFSVAAYDPDMIVIQSNLFPGGADPATHNGYRVAVSALYDIAQSRGAHTYIVRHARPAKEPEGTELGVAEALQAEMAAGRGIETIPLDAWLSSCDRPFTSDGWHLSAGGQTCHATALAGAVDQLIRSLAPAGS